MAYTPSTWADGEAGGTPITAAALNKIETGIDEAHTTADDAAPASHTHAVGDVSGLQSIIDDLTARIEALEAPEE